MRHPVLVCVAPVWCLYGTWHPYWAALLSLHTPRVCCITHRGPSAVGNHTISEVRAARKAAGVVPVMKRVDTCAAEFAATTSYMYATYDGEDESATDNKKKVLILGGGPNRIGQGIEFDYCCCHASFSLRCGCGLVPCAHANHDAAFLAFCFFL